jgi:hypothetical protein
LKVLWRFRTEHVFIFAAHLLLFLILLAIVIAPPTKLKPTPTKCQQMTNAKGMIIFAEECAAMKQNKVFAFQSPKCQVVRLEAMRILQTLC